MDADALDDLAARLFSAFEAYDLDRVGAMLTPDAVICQNGNEMGWADARPMILAFRGVLGDHRYTQVRRVTGNHVVVEEHHVESTTPEGRELVLPACVVIRVNADGLIERLDEYVDTSPLVAH